MSAALKAVCTPAQRNAASNKRQDAGCCCLTGLPPSPCCVLAAVPEPKVWEEEFDLNSVRLCFQASFIQPTGERIQLTPVVSQPIYDNSE